MRQCENLVVFEKLDTPAECLGKNYNQLWEDKDRLLEELHREFPKS